MSDVVMPCGAVLHLDDDLIVEGPPISPVPSLGSGLIGVRVAPKPRPVLWSTRVHVERLKDYDGFAAPCDEEEEDPR